LLKAKGIKLFPQKKTGGKQIPPNNKIHLLHPITLALPIPFGDPKTATKSSSSRCADPHYRLLLKEHGVIINPIGLLLPADVTKLMRKVLVKKAS